MDSKTTLYIVSDHGFGPQKNFLFINKWLSENEFLSIKKIRLLLYKLNSKIGNKRLFFKRNVDIVKHPIYRFINYKKSSFISGDQYEHGIYRIHDPESHESLKIINLLIEKLNRLRNNETEMPVFERIYKKNEIYSGEYVKNAPDIILKLNDYSTNILRDYPFRKNILLKSISPDGCHHPEGIIAAYGKDIVQGKKITASIMDITPTILYNMGIPIRTHMDGIVHKEIFKPKFQQDHEIVCVQDLDDLEPVTKRKNKYKRNEKEAITKPTKGSRIFRLKNINRLNYVKK